MAERPLSPDSGMPPANAESADADEYADFFDEDGNPTTDPAKIKTGYVMMRTPDGGWVHSYMTDSSEDDSPATPGRKIRRR